MNFELINLMSMNFKLINLMSMNFKLINLMSMNFVNKQISYFFPLRCFLILFGAFGAFQCFLCFFVLVKSYRKKKNKNFKTDLMTSFILLLVFCVNIAKRLRKPILRNICEGVLLAVGQQIIFITDTCLCYSLITWEK